MSLESDIRAALDRPRSLLELVEEMALRRGISLSSRQRIRDGDLRRHRDRMSELGYTPYRVYRKLCGMRGVTRRDANREAQDHARVQVEEWCRDQ